jgi:hypothetical protein
LIVTLATSPYEAPGALGNPLIGQARRSESFCFPQVLAELMIEAEDKYLN